jgi:hypothetical protein
LKIAADTGVKLDRSRPFEGASHHLWTKCGQNPHSAGLIEISAPDEQSSRMFQCYDLISHEPKSGKWWGMNNQNTAHFVPIDFKDLQICPSAYSVSRQYPRIQCLTKVIVPVCVEMLRKNDFRTASHLH